MCATVKTKLKHITGTTVQAISLSNNDSAWDHQRPNFSCTKQIVTSIIENCKSCRGLLSELYRLACVRASKGNITKQSIGGCCLTTVVLGYIVWVGLTYTPVSVTYDITYVHDVNAAGNYQL